MSKGMSLAIETIIILIIALTVFTALTYFFNLEFGKGKTTIDLLSGQNQWCGAYARQDSKCTTAGYNAMKTSKEGQETLKMLTYYCTRLQGYPNCADFTQGKCQNNDPSKCDKIAIEKCVFECCTVVCPAGTKPKPPVTSRTGPALPP